MTDQELLAEYAAHGAAGGEGAFAELVERHKDWVYSSCLRRLGDSALAEDATQAVFISLARKAEKVRGHRSVAAWLFTAARFTAMNLRKMERRRGVHEAEVALMNDERKEAGEEEAWREVAPGLERAMDRLPEKYRVAVLLRFYQKKTHQEIGEMLGISEENARKRVTRGVERLRGQLGVTIGAGSGVLGLGDVLGRHCVVRAPEGISASAMAQHVAAGSGASWNVSTGVLKMMYWAKVKMVAGVCAAAVLLSGATVMVVAESQGTPAVKGATADAVTTAPAAEPIQTLKGIDEAFAGCNADALPNLMLTDDEQQQAVVKAMQERLRIVKKLRTVLVAKGMGEQDVTKVSQDLTGGVPFSQKELDNTSTDVQGDTATMITRGDPRTAIVLRRVDGKWKVDLHSVGRGKKAPNELAAKLASENPVILELQGEVEKGDLLPEEFLRSFNAAMKTGAHVEGGAKGP